MKDFTHASEDDKENLLGREFRNICVLKSDCHSETHIVLNGHVLRFFGNPIECLKVYLAGNVENSVRMES